MQRFKLISILTLQIPGLSDLSVLCKIKPCLFLRGGWSLNIIANQIVLSSLGTANVFVCDRKFAKLLKTHPLSFLGLFHPSRQFHKGFLAISSQFFLICKTPRNGKPVQDWLAGHILLIFNTTRRPDACPG